MAVKDGVGGFYQTIGGKEERGPESDSSYLNYQDRQKAQERSDDLYGKADTNRQAVQANNPYAGMSRADIADAQNRQRGYQRQQQGTIQDQRGNIQDQRQLESYNAAMMAGKGPSVATGQLRQGIDQSIAAQVAAARSGSGPGGEAAAMRGAQQQAAGLQGGAAAQASQIRAAESQAAAQRQQGLYGQIGAQQQAIGSQYSDIGRQQQGLSAQEADIARQNLGQYGLESQNAIANGQLALGSRNADDQRTLGMYNAALGQQNLGSNILSNQQRLDMQGYQTRIQGDQAAREEGSDFFGGLLGAAGGLLNISDARAKDFQSDEDSKDFTPTNFGSFGQRGFSHGLQSGAKIGSAFAKGFAKLGSGKGPEVGGEDWAKKTLAEPAHDYQSPNRPDATQGPDWISSYMSGRGQQPELMGGRADPYGSSPAGLTDLRSSGMPGDIIRDDPYGSDENMKDFSGSMVNLSDFDGPIPRSASTGLGGVPVRGQVGGGGIVQNSGPKLPGGGGGSGGGMSYSSDKESKTPTVRKKGREAADDFMDEIHSYSYRYKDPRNEPLSEPTGGEYLGITAQDMEKAPTGKQIVVNTPSGKRVNTNAAVSAALASVARLNERLKAVENGKPLEDPRGSKNQPPPLDSSDRKSNMTPKKRKAS